MTSRREPPLDGLRAAIDSRLSVLGNVRPSRLNVSAWMCADSKWVKSLRRAGVLDAPASAELLDNYIRDRDHLLFSSNQRPSQASWSRHHLLASRRLAAVETFWQLAGFLTSRRYRAVLINNPRVPWGLSNVYSRWTWAFSTSAGPVSLLRKFRGT
jgi:hypothetical protein